MADLGSSRVFGKLTVMHDAIVKANAEITGTVTAANYVGLPTTATRWPTFSEVTGRPATYPPDSHNHDARYYTQAEVDTIAANSGTKFLFEKSLFGGL